MVTVESAADSNGSSGTQSTRALKLLITGWGPLNVTIPAQDASSSILSIDTSYPFGDSALIRAERVTQPFTLALRIPGWATEATLTIYASKSSASGKGRRRTVSRAPVVVPCVNGTYHDVQIGAGTTTLSLEFRPRIRLSYGWGPDGTNAVAVMRGSLLYALPLEERYVVTGALFQYRNDFTGCLIYYVPKTCSNIQLLFVNHIACIGGQDSLLTRLFAPTICSCILLTCTFFHVCAC